MALDRCYESWFFYINRLHEPSFLTADVKCRVRTKNYFFLLMDIKLGLSSLPMRGSAVVSLTNKNT